MYQGPDYKKFLESIQQAKQATGQEVSPGLPTGAANGAVASNPGMADPRNPQGMINAAMTGDQNQNLQQGMAQAAQTPNLHSQAGGGQIGTIGDGAVGGLGRAQGAVQGAFMSNGGSTTTPPPPPDSQLFGGGQNGSLWDQAAPGENGRIAGGLSSLSNAQLQALVNNYNLDMLNPDEYNKAMSPESQMAYQTGQAQMNRQNLGAFDQTQAGKWLQQAAWQNIGVDQSTPQGANSANLSRALMPLPPDPNAPVGYTIGRHQDYRMQQQKAWSGFMAAEKNRLLAGGNTVEVPNSGNPYGSQSIPGTMGGPTGGSMSGGEGAMQNGVFKIRGPEDMAVLASIQDPSQYPSKISAWDDKHGEWRTWSPDLRNAPASISESGMNAPHWTISTSPANRGNMWDANAPALNWMYAPKIPTAPVQGYTDPVSGMAPGANSSGLNGQSINPSGVYQPGAIGNEAGSGSTYSNPMISASSPGGSGGGSSEYGEGDSAGLSALRQANGISRGGEGGQQQQGGSGGGQSSASY